MARLTSVKQIWTFIVGYGIALAAILIGPAFATRILESHQHPTTGFALAMVAIGTLSLMPLVALIVWMYLRSDEYERHGMLLTASIGFALALMLMAALDMLQRTDLLASWVWSPRWWTVVLCWMIGMLAVHITRRRAA